MGAFAKQEANEGQTDFSVHEVSWAHTVLRALKSSTMADSHVSSGIAM